MSCSRRFGDEGREVGDDFDFGLNKPASILGEGDDGLGNGFRDGGLDFGFGEELQPLEPMEDTNMGNTGTPALFTSPASLLPLAISAFRGL